MTTIRTTAYALCFCDDGQHERPDLLFWRTTVERAEHERRYYPSSDGHMRQRVLVESDYATDSPTDEPDSPVGEIPPVCRTCSGSMRVPSSTRAGVTTPCPACLGYGFLAVAS